MSCETHEERIDDRAPGEAIPRRGGSALDATGALGESLPGDLRGAYTLRRRMAFAILGVTAAVLIAGFWNYRLVDGFGRDVVAAHTVGDPAALSTTFDQRGFGFGFLFAAVAGLAATFTACNCVVFAMLPGLVCAGGEESTGRGARHLVGALAAFTVGVVAVSVAYGFFVGMLGPEGIEAFNSRPVRGAQARTVFSLIGALLLVWGALELGFLEPLRQRASPTTRAFFSRPNTKAGLMGLVVGLFSVGRPFPVMRDFLTYAATAESPLYGAAVMIAQGLGQIAVMVILFVVLVAALRDRLANWAASRPHQMALTSALALVVGGTFFVFYWGLAFAFDIGRWGFRLGWYG